MSGLLQSGTPGVYVQIVPSGVRTISGVATSVTAFVGRTLRGPIDRAITISSYEEFEQRFGGIWAESELGYAVFQFFRNGGSRAVIARVARNTATSARDFAAAAGPALRLTAANPGAWGDRIRVTIDHGTVGTVTELTSILEMHLTVEEIDGAGEVVTRETYDRVSVDPVAARYVGRILETQSSLIRVANDSTQRPNAVVSQALQNGGDGNIGDDAAYDDALDLLIDADDVNIVCVPPPAQDQNTSNATWTAALNIAERRRALLIFDPPLEWADVDAARAFAMRHENVAVYYPRVRALDPLRNNLVRAFAPCGAVAGVLARTDADRGVWKAPAGQDARLIGVEDFVDELRRADLGRLNERGINALTALPLVGPVIYGARTSMGADSIGSEWKYLSVRRTALMIAESLFRGTQWAVFESNAEPLWAQLRMAVGSFMNDLFRKGAFAGSKPDDAYRVRCDSSTTVQADIDRGIVNIVVSFAPLNPAEFIVLKIQQLAGS